MSTSSMLLGVTVKQGHKAMQHSKIVQYHWKTLLRNYCEVFSHIKMKLMC